MILPNADSVEALAPFFRPRSIAVIGASGRAGNPFAKPLENLRRHGFDGAVYPVNPAYEELHGWRCYKSLAEIREQVDLALLLTPAASVVELVEACSDASVPAAIVYASGFGEAGSEGRARQATLAEVATRTGVRLLGPNCQGVVSVPHRMAATFSPALEDLPRMSSIGFVGQSGAVGGSLIDIARERGLGVAEWVSTGNQVDIGVVDVGAYLVELDHIRVVAMYMESLGDGRRFLRVARRAAELGKAVVVLRSGRSQAGRRAVASHTGSMLPDSAAFEVVAEAHGVILVHDLDELIRAVHALDFLPSTGGGRLAVISTSGGAGGIAADQLDDHDLELVHLTPSVRDSVSQLLPGFASADNPVDVTAQLLSRNPDHFAEICRLVGESHEVDQLVVILTMITGALAGRLADDIVSLANKLGKPVHLVWLAGRELTSEGRGRCIQASFPVYSSIRSMAEIARLLAQRGAHPPRVAPPEPGDDLAALLVGPIVIERAAGSFLDAIGVPRPHGEIAATAPNGSDIASRLQPPFVVKIQSPDVLHKTELGGVRVGVGVSELDSVVAELRQQWGNEIEILVQETFTGVAELVVAVTTNADGYPPLVTVGIGGITTEIYADLVSRPAPVTIDEAAEMLAQLRASRLLTGYRGRPMADVIAAAEAIAALSSAGAALGDRLVELEVNPLIVGRAGAGVCAADFMAILRPEPSVD